MPFLKWHFISINFVNEKATLGLKHDMHFYRYKPSTGIRKHVSWSIWEAHFGNFARSLCWYLTLWLSRRYWFERMITRWTHQRFSFRNLTEALPQTTWFSEGNYRIAWSCIVRSRCQKKITVCKLIGPQYAICLIYVSLFATGVNWQGNPILI